MKYRKRPVVVEAYQWWPSGHPSAPPDYKESDHPEVTRWEENPAYGWVNTLEGGHVVTPGDWIITGIQGEHYPCKPDIFAATYEPA